MQYVGDVIEYDRRKLGLSNEPLHMNQDTTSIEKIEKKRYSDIDRLILMTYLISRVDVHMIRVK